MNRSDLRRESGVLLPLFSLPSPHGVGSLGRAARSFLDQLADAGQSWWQLLPLGPTGYGDSPYQSLSSQAGNPYFIDLDLLAEEGLLTAEEIGGDWGSDPCTVDYGLLFERREQVLSLAWQQLKEPRFAALAQEFAAFS
ncbi:MAG: 4-alpha-glucanotransferase, partial [Firmicutes bacterium]|nr:4-alpha-glucanotransferase [Bacillota bacterium]